MSLPIQIRLFTQYIYIHKYELIGFYTNLMHNRSFRRQTISMW